MGMGPVTEKRVISHEKNGDFDGNELMVVSFNGIYKMGFSLW